MQQIIVIWPDAMCATNWAMWPRIVEVDQVRAMGKRFNKDRKTVVYSKYDLTLRLKEGVTLPVQKMYCTGTLPQKTLFT